MPRHIKFGLIFLAITLGLGVSYYYNLRKRISQFVHASQETPQPYLGVKPVFPKTAPLKRVKLFFSSRSRDGLLEVEEREIYSAQPASAEAKQIVAELIAGSKQGYVAPLAPETKLREVFIMDSGLAVVDLTKEASLNHPGGLTQEVSSIYAIVNSLTQNLPSVKRVQILIEGLESETLAGHIDLSHPLSEDLSMTSISRASEETAGPKLEDQTKNNSKETYEN